MQKHPSTKLIANMPIAVGEVTLVAWSNSVKLQSEGIAPEGPDFAILGGKYKFRMDKPDGRRHVLVDYWRVKRTGDEKHANMKVEMIERTIPLPNIARFDVTSPMSVSVPSLVVTKAIQKGEELVAHVPVKKKDVAKRTFVEVKPKVEPKSKVAKTLR